MTIRDLIYRTEVQGLVQIKKITEDNVVVVYESEDGLWSCKETEPFLDKEIEYIYVNVIPALCIEYREEEDC